jgi:hypothetical protein
MRFVVAALLVSAASAWTTSSSSSSSLPSSSSVGRRTSTTTTTKLFNVPPPSQEDTVAFKQYSSKLGPPSSFFELQQDCIRSAKIAIRDGIDLLEVEFPPLPAKVLELDDVSAYDVANANLKQAMDFARGFTSDGSKNVAILFPDEDEARIAIEALTGDDNTLPTVKVESGITVSSLRRSADDDDRFFKVREYCHCYCVCAGRGFSDKL